MAGGAMGCDGTADAIERGLGGPAGNVARGGGYVACGANGRGAVAKAAFGETLMTWLSSPSSELSHTSG